MSVDILKNDLEEFRSKSEAQRKEHLPHDVVNWEIIDGQLDEMLGKFYAGHDFFPVVGEWDLGRVLVVNRHGAMWTMSVEEFDAEYKAR